MKQLTVECKTLKNINDEELLYVVLSNGETKYNISVGRKTYDGVQELLNPKQGKLNLEKK